MSQYLYAYLVPDLNAVKIGRGDDPRSRMHDYCREYGIKPDSVSLYKWLVPATINADRLEKELHAWVEQDCKRITMNGSRELFQLGKRDGVDTLASIEEWCEERYSSLMDEAFPEAQIRLHEAEEIKRLAQITADKILTDAKREVSQMYADADRDVEATKTWVSFTNKQVQDRRRELYTLNQRWRRSNIKWARTKWALIAFGAATMFTLGVSILALT